MDAVYFLKHSDNADLEIRYSLRSVAQHAPWIRKVWIMGDRPEFLTSDTRLAEHVPYDQLARYHERKLMRPVTNYFLAYFLTCLHPEISSDMLGFSDDYVLLGDLTPEMARRMRHRKDLSKAKRPKKPNDFYQSLWRTADRLKSRGYPIYDGETHTPVYHQKRWVMDAYVEFRSHVTEDRLAGMLVKSTVLNYAIRHCGLPVIRREDEKLTKCFYHRPPTRQQIDKATDGKLFLNYNEDAFGSDLRTFLRERFPDPCRYEK